MHRGFTSPTSHLLNFDKIKLLAKSGRSHNKVNCSCKAGLVLVPDE